MVYVHAILFVVGLILVVKGAHFFVSSSSRIAKRLGVSGFIIGLTLVSIGTSIPELTNAIVASLRGKSGIVLGDVVGSNIANIGLILGLTASFVAVNIKKSMLKRDGYIMLSTVIIFYILAFNGLISRAESLLFLFIYISYVMFLVRSSKVKETYHFKEFLRYILNFEYLTTVKDSAVRKSKKEKKGLSEHEKKHYIAYKEGLIKDFFVFCLSCAALFYGARFIVSETIWFADLLSVPENIIAVSVIAFGTSLPELSVALKAIKSGLGDIVVGNVLGSNIANVLLILGVGGLIRPIEVTNTTLFFTAPVMILMSLSLLFFMGNRWKVGRIEGAGLFLMYVLFMASLIIFRM